MAQLKSVPGVIKRVHMKPNYSPDMVECGKKCSKNNLVVTSNPKKVTCSSCLATMGEISEFRTGPKAYKRAIKVITYTDFGQMGRKVEIGKHFSIATAMRQYARIWDIYGRKRIMGDREYYPRVWQEEQ